MLQTRYRQFPFTTFVSNFGEEGRVIVPSSTFYITAINKCSLWIYEGGGLDLLLFAGLIAAWFSCELVVVFSKLLEVIFGVALPYSLDWKSGETFPWIGLYLMQVECLLATEVLVPVHLAQM